MRTDFHKRICAIVLAGGKGNRLGSYIPKVLNPLAGKAMILHTLDILQQFYFPQVIIVIGFKAEIVRAVLGDFYNYAYQDPQHPKGTGDALKTGLTKIRKDCENIFVIYGDDSAFYKAETFKKFINFHLENENTLSFISAKLKDPYGLGRLVRDSSGKLIRVVEEAEATEQEKQIKEINVGVYLFKKAWVEKAVSEIKVSSRGEYYITDLISIALNHSEKIGTYRLEDPNEWWGINTQAQLDEANRRMILKLKERKKSETTFIIDVDNTILNTDRLKQVLVSTILDVLKIETLEEKEEIEKIFWQTYEQIREENGYIDIPATAERFCANIGKDEFAKIIAYFLLLVPSPSLLYPLVYQTIDRLKDYGRVVIFTDGDLIYQPLKVERIGIPHLVSRSNIYIFQDKIPYIQDILSIHESSQKVFVIDDRIRVIEEFKALRKDVIGVLVKQGGYAEDLSVDKLKAADFIVHNFAELLDLSKHFRYYEEKLPQIQKPVQGE